MIAPLTERTRSDLSLAVVDKYNHSRLHTPWCLPFCRDFNKAKPIAIDLRTPLIALHLIESFRN